MRVKRPAEQRRLVLSSLSLFSVLRSRLRSLYAQLRTPQSAHATAQAFKDVHIGSRNSSVVARQTRIEKSWVRAMAGATGRIFLSRVNLLYWLLFQYPFHSRVTAVAREDPGHFVKSAGGRLQLNTHAPYVSRLEYSKHCKLVRDCNVYGAHRTWADTAAVSRGTSHVTTYQRCFHFGGYSSEKRCVKL